jgi:plasmid stabilization system protein ParE
VRVRWTEQAFARLADIEDCVAAGRPAAARRLSARLAHRASTLARNPRIGRLVPELPGTELRELIEGHYRIVYRVRPRAVEILTVFEGHRLLPLADIGMPAQDDPQD